MARRQYYYHGAKAQMRIFGAKAMLVHPFCALNSADCPKTDNEDDAFVVLNNKVKRQCICIRKSTLQSGSCISRDAASGIYMSFDGIVVSVNK